MTTAPRTSISDEVRGHARALGFEAVGIARCGRGVGIDRDFARFEAFLAAGMHGEMAWLAKYGQARERLDGEAILPGARSVICVARRYGPAEQDGDSQGGTSAGRALDPAGGGVAPAIARYARGRDYHGFMRRRLRRLAAFVRSLGASDGRGDKGSQQASGSADIHPTPGLADARLVEARPLCDEEPVLERAWAVRAGLGFVGKNGMLIVPGLGSMVLLGEVVTTLDLDPGGDSPPMSERCGSCTRCIDACPTGAFPRPFVLDARRCVSYLTIEQRGAMALDLRAGVGSHLFGCDDCQTVCPFNAGAGARAPLDDGDGDPFAPLERWGRTSLEDLLAMDQAGWLSLREGTPLARAGRCGLARNAAVVLGNRGDERALTALRKAAASHEDPVVRDAATWAIARIEERAAAVDGGARKGDR